MKHLYGLLLAFLLLLLAGCVHIIIPVPIFLAAPPKSAAVVPTPLPLSAQALTQTSALTTTSAITDITAVTATQMISSEHLSQALALTPTDARAAYFTDWTVIKQYKGMATLNSQSPIDQQTEFLMALSKDQAAPNVYGSRAFLRFADTWSWNSTDLNWEVAVDSARATVHILKFRDDFDFAPVLAHFNQRGFQQQTIDGATVYTHTPALSEDWFTIGELSIANTAVISEEKIIVLSSEMASVKAVLDIYHHKAAALHNNADLRATVAGLGDIAAAIITPGIDTCRGLSFEAISEQLRQTEQITDTQILKLKEQLVGDAQFHIYNGFAIGYQYSDGKPIGRLVMHYPKAADAQADLEPRRNGAATGLSLVNNTPYTETLFTMDSATVNGNNLLFQLRPYEDQPSRLFQMFFSRDMAFAGCP
ncbi:hypothetical protein BH10CHL1_BH10CHL1_20800 [soil metagenome]